VVNGNADCGARIGGSAAKKFNTTRAGARAAKQAARISKALCKPGSVRQTNAIQCRQFACRLVLRSWLVQARLSQRLVCGRMAALAGRLETAPVLVKCMK
jgi:hypothetical protein